MPEQLGFDLPGIPALERADFMVAPSNALAVAMIENWHSWSGGKMVLCGPEGAGKTHLVHVWAAMTGAQIVQAVRLDSMDIPTLASGPVAVEDVHKISGDTTAQTALFHLHNLVLADGNPMLLTGEGVPGRWGLDLADLASRVDSAPIAVLEAPDDALLAAILAKLFSDRQIMPRPDVIPYLTRRMDRSFAAARDIVAALDTASLSQKRPVTRSLASSVLDKQQSDG